MKIPKKFKLFGREVAVNFRDDLSFQEHAWGRASERMSRIEIQKSIKGHEISNEIVEQTFFHELVHMILFAMDERELNENEKFVSVFSSLMHQAFQTAEYD